MKTVICIFLNKRIQQVSTSGLFDYLLYLIHTQRMFDKFFLIVFVTHGQTRQGHRGIFQSALTPTRKGNFQSRLTIVSLNVANDITLSCSMQL